MPERSLQELPIDDLMLLDGFGYTLSLARIVRDKATVIIFIRHFGSSDLGDHVKGVLGNRGQLSDTGSKLIFIGGGSKAAMEQFQRTYGIPTECLFRDPKLKTFEALGFFQQWRPQGVDAEYLIPLEGILASRADGKVVYRYQAKAA